MRKYMVKKNTTQIVIINFISNKKCNLKDSYQHAKVLRYL